MVQFEGHITACYQNFREHFQGLVKSWGSVEAAAKHSKYSLSTIQAALASECPSSVEVPLAGHPDYVISPFGYVRRTDKLSPVSVHYNGSMMIKDGGGKYRSRMIGRLVWATFNGSIPEHHVVTSPGTNIFRYALDRLVLADLKQGPQGKKDEFTAIKTPRKRRSRKLAVSIGF